KVVFTSSGVTWNATTVRAKVLVPTSGDDSIVGYLGADKLFGGDGNDVLDGREGADTLTGRSEEHTSELQSLAYLACRLLLEKKKKKYHELGVTLSPTDVVNPEHLNMADLAKLVKTTESNYSIIATTPNHIEQQTALSIPAPR